MLLNYVINENPYIKFEVWTVGLHQVNAKTFNQHAGHFQLKVSDTWREEYISSASS